MISNQSSQFWLWGGRDRPGDLAGGLDREGVTIEETARIRLGYGLGYENEGLEFMVVLGANMVGDAIADGLGHNAVDFTHTGAPIELIEDFIDPLHLSLTGFGVGNGLFLFAAIDGGFFGSSPIEFIDVAIEVGDAADLR